MYPEHEYSSELSTTKDIYIYIYRWLKLLSLVCGLYKETRVFTCVCQIPTSPGCRPEPSAGGGGHRHSDLLQEQRLGSVDPGGRYRHQGLWVRWLIVIMMWFMQSPHKHEVLGGRVKHNVVIKTWADIFIMQYNVIPPHYCECLWFILLFLLFDPTLCSKLETIDWRISFYFLP